MSNHPLTSLDGPLERPAGGAATAVRGRPDAGARRDSPRPRFRLPFAPMGLFAVLTVQAVLSLRLVWSNTAFLDEATYLNAGHVELAHWLTGAPEPAFATYFSGAPVIYPPLAALANDVAGLAGARILSLCFMLGATSLLWGTASRLVGRLAAFYAAALFALLGPTQYLGAFATYDAMALFFLAASAWCVVAAARHDDSAMLVLGAAALLVLSNATKYATGLFDPVIVGLGAICVADKRGLKAGLARGGYLAVAVTGMIGALLAIGGSWYLTGVLSTTLARAAGDTAPGIVVANSVKWIGAVVLLATVAALVTAARIRTDRVATATMAVLAAAGFLVTVNQARIHTATSLSKHVDFGAWFAAIAAGYLLAAVTRLGRRKSLNAITVALIAGGVVLPIGVIGRAQGASFFQAWPNASQVVRIIGSLARTHPGNYLAEDYDVDAYYLENQITWQHWSNTWYFTYTPPGSAHQLEGLAAWRAAILNHYFSLIILDFGDTAHVDEYVTKAIRQSGDYHVIAEAPDWDSYGTGQFTIWAYQPPRAPSVHRLPASPGPRAACLRARARARPCQRPARSSAAAH